MHIDLIEGGVSLGARSNVAVTALARCRLTACLWSMRRAALFVVVVVAVVVCVIVGLDPVRVSFLGMGVLVAMAVGVAARSMAVSDVVEEDKTNKVRGQTEGTDDKNKLRLGDFLRLDESLNGFEEDGET